MSEKRLSLFPQNPKESFPDEDLLISILAASNFIELDTNAHSNGNYILSTEFYKLLEWPDQMDHYSKKPVVWFENHELPEIQIGADSQHIEKVRTPDKEVILGDLDFVYTLIGALDENIEAEYTNPKSGISYKIRDLDFMNFIGYGKTFVHIDCYIKPTNEFIAKFEAIVKINTKYSQFWL